MKKVFAILVLATSFAWAQVPDTLPSQVAFVTAQYDQSGSPAFTGGVGYAVKPQSSGVPFYSYTLIRETSLSLGKTTAIQTRTETGGCAYTRQFALVRIWGCGTVGIVTANSTAKISGTGQVLLTVPIGKSPWFVGAYGGPSYSGIATTALSYPVGVLVGFGTR